MYMARGDESPMCDVCIGLLFFEFHSISLEFGPLEMQKWYVWVGSIWGGALILHRVNYGPAKGRMTNTAVCAGGEYVFLKTGIFKKTIV